MKKLLAFPSILITSAPIRAALPQYVIHDLGTFGGRSADVTGINNQGQLVGYVLYEGGKSRAYMRDGTFHDLGTGRANAINDAGLVVGLGGADESGSAAFGFTWDGTRNDVSIGYLHDVNCAGEMVGQAIPAFHAFLGTSTGTTDLGTLGGSDSSALAMNDAGAVVGVSSLGTYPEGLGGFYWKNEGMKDIGSFGGSITMALDINNHDLVVGWSDSPIDTQGFYWDGVLHSLGAGHLASGVNDLGWIVGNNQNQPSAFLWIDGTFAGLPLAGTSCTVSAINDAGVIVGSANVGGHRHAVIWEPVPEPGTALVLLSGLTGCATLRLRARRTRG